VKIQPVDHASVSNVLDRVKMRGMAFIVAYIKFVVVHNSSSSSSVLKRSAATLDEGRAVLE